MDENISIVSVNEDNGTRMRLRKDCSNRNIEEYECISEEDTKEKIGIIMASQDEPPSITDIMIYREQNKLSKDMTVTVRLPDSEY